MTQSQPFAVALLLELADESRGIAGYICHRASVALHDVAWPLLVDEEQQTTPAIWFVVEDHGGYTRRPNVTLADVAPRTAAARDWLRRKVEHACWLASDLGRGRG